MQDRTETDIANMAADMLDIDPIGNIDSGVGNAKLFKRNYREAVETVLSEFTWNNATTISLVAPVPVPAGMPTGYAHAYAWPVDCVRMVKINGLDCHRGEVRWENKTLAIPDNAGNVISRRKLLLCDLPPVVHVEYIGQLGPADMSAHCAKAIAIELAMRCCTAATNSTSKMEQLKVDYAEATKGSQRRVGGFQVDSRSNNARPERDLPSAGARYRHGIGV